MSTDLRLGRSKVIIADETENHGCELNSWCWLTIWQFVSFGKLSLKS